MDESPEQNMRQGVRDKHGRYMSYSTCERCNKRPSVGLTVLAYKADGSYHWEGYACKPCRKELKTEVTTIGGTYEE